MRIEDAIRVETENLNRVSVFLRGRAEKFTVSLSLTEWGQNEYQLHIPDVGYVERNDWIVFIDGKLKIISDEYRGMWMDYFNEEKS